MLWDPNLVSSVPADGLAPNGAPDGARSSADSTDIKDMVSSKFHWTNAIFHNGQQVMGTWRVNILANLNAWFGAYPIDKINGTV